jgi:hypothetical protein
MMKPLTLTKGPRATPARTFAALALLLACALPAAAQGGAKEEKGAAVRRLFEAAGVRKFTAALFEESVSRYQKNWPDAVIAGYREKNLFAGLTPRQTAQMEQLIREFGDRIFSKTKARVTGELITDDGLVALSAPAFEKYLTDEDLARLTDFVRTPAGQKFINVAARHLSDALLNVMESKGVFQVSSDPDADVAKLDRLRKEMGAGGLFADVQQRLAGLAVLLPAEFTPEELREIAAFWQSPLGAKLTESYPPLSAEILQRNAALYAPRAGEISQQVMDEQMEFFKAGVAEIFKNAGPRTRRAARRRRD